MQKILKYINLYVYPLVLGVAGENRYCAASTTILSKIFQAFVPNSRSETEYFAMNRNLS